MLMLQLLACFGSCLLPASCKYYSRTAYISWRLGLMPLLMSCSCGSSVRLLPIPLMVVAVGVVVAMMIVVMMLANVCLSLGAITCGANSS